MIVVPDAGPLIYLAGAGQLDLLRRLFARVVVPRVVHDEVVVAGAGLLGSAEVAAAVWIEIMDGAPDSTLLPVLDAGEAAAIPLAQRLGATLLCDDGDARVIARQRGLLVVGTLGVLLKAKREGALDLVAPVIATMTKAGMFVSASLRSQILLAAGETPD